jgi:nicotinamidase-related amidase
VLRNAGINNVSYTGVLTSACVLLTAGGGWDLGYSGYVITDATATITPALQTAGELMISYYMADLVTADDVMALIKDAD